MTIFDVPSVQKSRIGRVWTDGNGVVQHWTACSEIWHLAWFVGAVKSTSRKTK